MIDDLPLQTFHSCHVLPGDHPFFPSRAVLGRLGNTPVNPDVSNLPVHWYHQHFTATKQQRNSGSTVVDLKKDAFIYYIYTDILYDYTWIIYIYIWIIMDTKFRSDQPFLSIWGFFGISVLTPKFVDPLAAEALGWISSVHPHPGCD